MRGILASTFLIGCAWAAPASASVPVIDVLQLDRHSDAKRATVKLVPVKDGRKTSNSGVTCAVTTGRKAQVRDPSVQPRAGAGAQAVQAYAPELPKMSTAGATGGRLGRETDFQAAAAVVGGVEASLGSVAANHDLYATLSGQVGSASTVMAAMDQNSAIRLQNGLSWGQAINAGNLWVQALNAGNLVGATTQSRTATAMRFPVVVSPAPTPPTQPPGNGGCRAGQIPNPNPAMRAVEPCVIPRYVDAHANVSAYLGQVQGAATADAAPIDPVNPAANTLVTSRAAAHLAAAGDEP